MRPSCSIVFCVVGAWMTTAQPLSEQKLRTTADEPASASVREETKPFAAFVFIEAEESVSKRGDETDETKQRHAATPLPPLHRLTRVDRIFASWTTGAARLHEDFSRICRARAPPVGA
jgi:hypothetical protein